VAIDVAVESAGGSGIGGSSWQGGVPVGAGSSTQ